jgi:hypothetical protein
LQVGKDLDAEVAGDFHPVLLDEVTAGHLRDGTEEEDEAIGDEQGNDGGPAVRPGGVIDDLAGDAGKSERAAGHKDEEAEDAEELELVGLEKAAGADKRPKDFVAGAVAGHGGLGVDAIISGGRLNLYVGEPLRGGFGRRAG